MNSKNPHYTNEVRVMHKGFFRKGFFFSENFWNNKIKDSTNVGHRDYIATYV